MGPLRFEWGWNLDPRPGESKKVAEFTIGTAF
jgi:outer membrane protein assembly factor BamA